MDELFNMDRADKGVIMDSDFRDGDDCRSSPEANFAFAFNDSNFSDRVLRIEIFPDLPGAKSDEDGCPTIASWARNRKRRREEIRKENDAVMQPEEQILKCNVPDIDDVGAFESQDEETMAMIDESPLEMTCVQLGDKETKSDDSLTNEEVDHGFEITTIHISSPILAAKSPFFYKLFSNGMRESEQRLVTLRIHASEEAALMELLNFMYSNRLSTTSPTALLDILTAADKYEVASCMRYCSRLLRNLPMTIESALLYMDLPFGVSVEDAIQPLADAAKQFLADRYKDLAKYQEEVLNLPLAGIEAVLASDDLQVASEDAVYDFVLKWARIHYPKVEERREILETRLCHLIRFPCMSCRKLRKVLTCNDFDPELASKVVLDALFFRAEAPYRQRSLVSKEASTSYCRYVERAYKYRPVKVVEFESPREQCIVYLDLKREECVNLFPAGRVYSQAFHLGRQGFFLSAHCNMDQQQNSIYCFGLFLGMQEKGTVTFSVDYEFAARSKSTCEYTSKYKGTYKFTGGKAVGYRNLFGMPWTAFVADDSPYFINGVLHLRAELTIRQ